MKGAAVMNKGRYLAFSRMDESAKRLFGSVLGVYLFFLTGLCGYS